LSAHEGKQTKFPATSLFCSLTIDALPLICVEKYWGYKSLKHSTLCFSLWPYVCTLISILQPKSKYVHS